MTLYRLIAEAAALAGDRPAFMVGDRCALRYDEIDRAAVRLSGALAALGVTTGDRVLVQVEKSVEAALLWLACLRMGAVMVPLNTAYTPAEVAFFVEDAAPALVICDPGSAEALGAVAGAVPVATLGADGQGTLGEVEAGPIAEVSRQADDLAAILYTSGTTGRSKGAMLSHGNLASNALVLKDLWGWRDGDVLIHALPIYHVHGLFVALHGALLNGSTMLWHACFDARAVLTDCARASVLMGVPTFYSRLLAEPGLSAEAVAGMRLFVSGSAPLLPQTFAEWAARTGKPILERYGMTEAGMIASNPLDGERIAGTVGFALPGTQLRIADGDGRAVADGEPGVIEIAGPNLFKGYWRAPDKTAEAHRPDGFFITGDVAVRDATGRVSIVGRAKDLIIAGGLNIYPREIEAAIDTLPGVVESAVIGVAHPDLGEGVVAVVVGETTADAVAEGLAGRLARFKQPRRTVIVDALPRNAMGKVEKARLRADYADSFTGAASRS